MAQVNTKDFSTLPVGRLGLIPPSELQLIRREGE